MAVTSELQAYLHEVGRYPVLSKEAQLRHCRRIWDWIHHPDGRDNAPRPIARAGRRSMDAMVTTNLRLVISVAKRYQNRGLDFPDLIQEGNLGLIRGLELFDPSRGYSITTYAYWWIRQAITRAIYTHGRPIRLPINSYEILNKVHTTISNHLAAHGTPPSLAVIAETINTSPERLQTVLNSFDATQCLSLDAPVRGESDSTFLDFIESLSSSPEDEDNLSLRLTCFLSLLQDGLYLNEALLNLEPREAYVVRKVFYEGAIIRDIAAELELSRSRVRQIQSKALAKLRARFAATADLAP